MNLYHPAVVVLINNPPARLKELIGQSFHAGQCIYCQAVWQDCTCGTLEEVLKDFAEEAMETHDCSSECATKFCPANMSQGETVKLDMKTQFRPTLPTRFRINNPMLELHRRRAKTLLNRRLKRKLPFPVYIHLVDIMAMFKVESEQAGQAMTVTIKQP